MFVSADFMRLLLTLTVLGMAMLAAFFLRKRKLTLSQYLAWGLLAVLLPLVGPFLVIALAPGKPHPARSRLRKHRHFSFFTSST